MKKADIKQSESEKAGSNKINGWALQKYVISRNDSMMMIAICVCLYCIKRAALGLYREGKYFSEK